MRRFIFFLGLLLSNHVQPLPLSGSNPGDDDVIKPAALQASQPNNDPLQSRIPPSTHEGGSNPRPELSLVKRGDDQGEKQLPGPKEGNDAAAQPGATSPKADKVNRANDAAAQPEATPPEADEASGDSAQSKVTPSGANEDNDAPAQTEAGPPEAGGDGDRASISDGETDVQGPEYWMFAGVAEGPLAERNPQPDAQSSEGIEELVHDQSKRIDDAIESVTKGRFKHLGLKWDDYNKREELGTVIHNDAGLYNLGPITPRLYIWSKGEEVPPRIQARLHYNNLRSASNGIEVITRSLELLHITGVLQLNEEEFKARPGVPTGTGTLYSDNYIAYESILNEKGRSKLKHHMGLQTGRTYDRMRLLLDWGFTLDDIDMAKINKLVQKNYPKMKLTANDASFQLSEMVRQKLLTDKDAQAKVLEHPQGPSIYSSLASSTVVWKTHLSDSLYTVINFLFALDVKDKADKALWEGFLQDDVKTFAFNLGRNAADDWRQVEKLTRGLPKPATSGIHKDWNELRAMSGSFSKLDASDFSREAIMRTFTEKLAQPKTELDRGERESNTEGAMDRLIEDMMAKLKKEPGAQSLNAEQIAEIVEEMKKHATQAMNAATVAGPAKDQVKQRWYQRWYSYIKAKISNSIQSARAKFSKSPKSPKSPNKPPRLAEEHKGTAPVIL